MKYLYFTIGVPGIGKSTFFKKASKELFGDENFFENYTISPGDYLPSLKEGASCPM